MKEQSHKREMSAAVRGDFARLRARGVATSMPVESDSAPGGEAVPGAPPLRPAEPEPRRVPFGLLRRR